MPSQINTITTTVTRAAMRAHYSPNSLMMLTIERGIRQMLNKQVVKWNPGEVLMISVTDNPKQFGLDITIKHFPWEEDV